MKKVVSFFLSFIPWFLGILFMRNDQSFYASLTLPWFAPPPIVFSIVWTILYILIAISITKVFSKSDGSYKKTLFINYLFNQLFSFFFFTLQSPFFGFVDCVAVFVSSLFLYYETKKIDRKASLLLLPYVLWSLFATILSLTIYLMNVS